MRNIDSDTLRRLLNNPHYKPNKKQEDVLGVFTQDVRTSDENVTVPKVRKKRAKRSSRRKVSNQDIRAEVPKVSDVS